MSCGESYNYSKTEQCSMNKIKNIIDARRLEFRGLSFEEKLLVINSVCLFLPFFLVGIPFIITVICCLVRKETRQNIFRVSHASSFIAFGIVGLFAAIANKNLPGIGGGIFILFLIALYQQKRVYPLNLRIHPFRKNPS